MKIEIQDKGSNTKQLEMTLETSDIGPKIKSELNKIRAKTDIKGFRKGKTPMSFVKRMYGKRVAIEVISEKSQEALNEYIKEQDFDLINQPIMTESSIPAVEDGGLDDDCSFTYLLGLMPDITLTGISSEDTYEYLEIDVTDEQINERMEAMQKQVGGHEHPDDILETDIVELDAIELDGGELKEDGHGMNFRFAMDLVDDEDLKKSILKLNKGDSFDFDIYKLERDRNDEYVQKYLMKIEEGQDGDAIGRMFRGTIKEIHRHVSAELNEDFFEKAFPEHVTNEAEAREEIRKSYITGYQSVGDNMVLKKVIDTITENNQFDLPNEYITQLLKDDKGSTPSPEQLEQMQESVRRQIIVSLLIKKLKIEVSHDDMREKVMQEFTANFGGMTLPPETVDKIVGNAMQDEKYVRELSDRVLNDKLISGVKDAVSLDIKQLKEDELMKVYEETFPKPDEEE